MVDLQHNSLQHALGTQNSSSSAVDLTGTPTGFGNSGPSSPALDPLDASPNRARRRASWGRVEAGQDPLHLNMDPDLSNSNRRVLPKLPLDDPFFSPTEETKPRSYSIGSRYGDGIRPGYGTTQSGQSSASLIGDSDRESRDDDEARLTGNVPGMEGSSSWPEDAGTDAERIGGLTPRSRRRTVRYSVSPSPLRKTGSTFANISRSIRRVSLRVVNLTGTAQDESIRLPDGDDDQKGEDWKGEELPDLGRDIPIRGRTLGFLGPQSRVRLKLYHILVHS